MNSPSFASADGAPDDRHLSGEELALLRAIGGEEVRGLAVTYRQLQELTGYKSNYSVQLLAKKLAARGFVALNPGAARAIRLTRLGLSVVTEGVGAIHVLPIRGVRRSFHAAWAEADAIEQFPLSGNIFNPSADYLIVGAGDATFPERGIVVDDLIAIQKTSTPQHQQLFLEESEGRLRLGKTLPHGDGWKLVGSGDAWVNSSPRILGRVVGLLRTSVTSRKRCPPDRGGGKETPLDASTAGESGLQ